MITSIHPIVVIALGLFFLIIFNFFGFFKPTRRSGLTGLLPWLLLFGGMVYLVIYYGDVIHYYTLRILDRFP